MQNVPIQGVAKTVTSNSEQKNDGDDWCHSTCIMLSNDTMLFDTTPACDCSTHLWEFRSLCTVFSYSDLSNWSETIRNMNLDSIVPWFHLISTEVFRLGECWSELIPEKPRTRGRFVDQDFLCGLLGCCGDGVQCQEWDGAHWYWCRVWKQISTNIHSLFHLLMCVLLKQKRTNEVVLFPFEPVNVAALKYLSLMRRVSSLVEQIHQNSERCQQCWNRLTWISTCCELASPRSLTFWSFLPNWIWMTMGWLVVSEQRLGNWLICHFCWWTTISWLERFRENLVIWQISNCNFAFQFVQRYHAAVDGIDQRLPWWILAPLSALCGMCNQCFKSKNAAMDSLLHYNL